MKQSLQTLLFGLLMILLPFFSEAQSNSVPEEYIKIYGRNEAIPAEAYIDSAFAAKFNLRYTPQPEKRMNVWQNREYYKSKSIIRVYDLRWKFNSNKEALDFHNKYLSINAENGVEIKNYKFNIENVKSLRVFKESDELRKTSDKSGYPMGFYCFLFVKDNYVAKVYVNTKPGITVDAAAIFAIEAAKKLNYLVVKK